MNNVIWIPAPRGITGDLESWVDYMDAQYPAPNIDGIYLMEYEDGKRVGYRYKGIHPQFGNKWWQRVKEKIVESYFRRRIHSAVLGETDSVLTGMTQLLDSEIMNSIERLADEGFEDEILADYAHQMSKN